MNSKNLILSTLVKLWLVVLSFVSINSFAQRIEITPSYGFHFGTKLDYGPNYIEVEDSGQWGITLGVETFDDVMVELSYTRMNTELSIRDVDLSPS
ncbi:MAG: hypothetical protein JJ936_11375, partial [Psychroserpens sp.]|nr:hypothetical protein [Psychroserpens sp.]